MSSVVNFTSSSDNNDGGYEQLDFLNKISCPTVDGAANLSLSPETFLEAAVALKEQVVKVTWTEVCAGGVEIVDPTVYTGLLGTAFTCLRFYEATGSHRDLQLSADIVDACATNTSTRYMTFLCGRGGIYALGAVIANHCGDHRKRDFYLAEFMELAQETALPAGPEEGGFGMSYDLLHGRAGFLWAALFINKHIGQETVPSDTLNPIVKAVIAGGRAGAPDHAMCPLMYRWHGTRYWGAAHGLAGILHVLLHFPLSEEDAEDVKKTLKYMMSKRFPHTGNYPSSEGNARDNLVQWSHGAGGMAITLCKASQVFPHDRELRDAAIEAGEVVWKSGLVEKAGLADGASGNAYAFLALYRLTGDAIYVDRAKAFGGFLYANARKLMTSTTSHGLDHGFSLFQGLAGVACLWSDLVRPEDSRFPGFEI
ncbi:putative lanthionine synthetase C, six-hairpin glycosidase-like superfamily [Helianthus annuus]|uniref:Lanthionine synthetase C, six-hairpin glycosidase-like superfamily n=1 Tax=Helianthus annuus TaxID=4232 RepID=A0A251SHT0_HELAN|nr:lanC-like protein GCL1 [Helianthus annuus]KAF5769387.1 putative lanthionine synthetase C, six-hairpin glycosidase-like superfamily [Helianthus annuus]KAJ0464420.1 putative lanthionine synthetase C, six-hairpin glycosidase-like superfamily [Helianthus annuus]KAJ0468944.1 putative lanthionine synthetase C, six-hairpin glycosidase-like superfamily [Helianthus annuus]KAJ0485996.1 putative lanthionine synthetase C, six-hairpin glycosidase-like superfamily [Helianthus annuus]KAJ0656551.1 putative